MPIGRRPLLEYWLQTLYEVGIHSVLVNLHYCADEVATFLARPRFVEWVKSVYEPELLGTAGTLRRNGDFFAEGTTLLVHADNWCQCDFGGFIAYHQHVRPKQCAITMMTFDTDAPQSCGIVETDSENIVLAFHEKVANPPGCRANAAVYLLEPEVLTWIKENPEVSDFSTQVLPHYLGRIAVWHNQNIHRDIGTFPELLRAQLDPLPVLHWSEADEWQKKFLAHDVLKEIDDGISNANLERI